MNPQNPYQGSGELPPPAPPAVEEIRRRRVTQWPWVLGLILMIWGVWQIAGLLFALPDSPDASGDATLRGIMMGVLIAGTLTGGIAAAAGLAIFRRSHTARVWGLVIRILAVFGVILMALIAVASYRSCSHQLELISGDDSPEAYLDRLLLEGQMSRVWTLAFPLSLVRFIFIFWWFSRRKIRAEMNLWTEPDKFAQYPLLPPEILARVRPRRRESNDAW